MAYRISKVYVLYKVHAFQSSKKHKPKQYFYSLAMGKIKNMKKKHKTPG